MSRNGPDIDHHSPGLGDERQQRLGQSDGADHVDFELASDRLRRDRLERALDNDPRHVDETDEFGIADDRREVTRRRLDGRRIVEIEPDRLHATWPVRDADTSRIAGHRDHIASVSREAFDKRFADSCARPGDDGPCWSGIGPHREFLSFAAWRFAINMKVPSASGNSLS